MMITLDMLTHDLAVEYAEFYRECWPGYPEGGLDTWLEREAREILDLAPDAELPQYVESLVAWLYWPTARYQYWPAPGDFEVLLGAYSVGLYRLARNYFELSTWLEVPEQEIEETITRRYGYIIKRDGQNRPYVAMF